MHALVEQKRMSLAAAGSCPTAAGLQSAQYCLVTPVACCVHHRHTHFHAPLPPSAHPTPILLSFLPLVVPRLPSLLPSPPYFPLLPTSPGCWNPRRRPPWLTSPPGSPASAAAAACCSSPSLTTRPRTTTAPSCTAMSPTPSSSSASTSRWVAPGAGLEDRGEHRMGSRAPGQPGWYRSWVSLAVVCHRSPRARTRTSPEECERSFLLFLWPRHDTSCGLR